MAGVDPTIMGIGPVYAIRSLLKKNNMSLGDIELVEVSVWGVCHLVSLHDLYKVRHLGGWFVFIQWNPSIVGTIRTNILSLIARCP